MALIGQDQRRAWGRDYDVVAFRGRAPALRSREGKQALLVQISQPKQEDAGYSPGRRTPTLRALLGNGEIWYHTIPSIRRANYEGPGNTSSRTSISLPDDRPGPRRIRIPGADVRGVIGVSSIPFTRQGCLKWTKGGIG